MTTAKDEIRAALDAARDAYNAAVRERPAAFLAHPSAVPGWSNAEVLHHITIGMRVIPLYAWAITTSWSVVRWALPRLPLEVVSTGNHWLARVRIAHTSETLMRAYQTGDMIIRKSLARYTEADMTRRMEFPAWNPEFYGWHTLREAFLLQRQHTDQHLKHLSS